MAVKIITKGKGNKRIYRTRCATCSCVFEFEAEDAKFVADQRDGDFYQIKCPDCGKMCYAEDKVARYERA